MSKAKKELASSFLTGGGGLHFEENVQASFVGLMLAGGYAPCLSNWPITKIKLQGRHADYNTDDLIVFTEDNKSGRKRRLLGQVKHGAKITAKDPIFKEVIQAAWSDFNNSEIFTKGRNGDVIGLITGPLNTTDIDSVRPLLERARQVEDHKEFFKDIALTKFTSDTTREKLEAFKVNLKIANDNKDLAESDLHEFLKHFHLLSYDLDIKAGVNIALLNTIISNGTGRDPADTWGQIVLEVRSANQNAGTLSLQSLPEELVERFKEKEIRTAPSELFVSSEEPITKDWSEDDKASNLVVACLVGDWQESSQGDMQIVRDLVTGDFEVWKRDMRSILKDESSPITLRNGHWKVKDRELLWKELSDWVFDEHLERIQKAAVQVLSEVDPRMEIAAEKRELASISGTENRFSISLREGLSETIGFLGNRGDQMLKKCSQHKPGIVAILAVREILSDADYKKWGSLNYQLPLLAEAAPKEFILTVEQALVSHPSPFTELFSQEGVGIFGQNYLTGLFWGLENLAWQEEWLVRVSELLAGLAEIDPGGKWSERPLNSLSKIFLPWMTQTLASFETQLVAMRTIQKEHPKITWKLLLSLLPSHRSHSSGSHKPKWLDLTEDQILPKITNLTYWNRVNEYAKMALEMAKDSGDTLREFIINIDKLPEKFQDDLTEFLKSNEANKLTGEEKQEIWKSTVTLAAKHRRFFDTDWALPESRIEKLEALADNLAPKSPRGLHSRLFQQNDYDLYEESEDWEAERKKLESKRNDAVGEILQDEGLEAVLKFLEEVESPFEVGAALGRTSGNKIDLEILPEKLEDEPDRMTRFVSAYITTRLAKESWVWVDELDRSSWTRNQSLQLLLKLPFTNESWKRASDWLGDDEKLYWKSVLVWPQQAEGNLFFAVDKLLEVRRPFRAIDCLECRRYRKEPLDVPRTVKALMGAVTSKEANPRFDEFHIVQLITALQEDTSTPEGDMFNIEWAYLKLLGPHGGGEPFTLEKRLSTDPKFFCDVLRLIYKSDRDVELSKGEKNGRRRSFISIFLKWFRSRLSFILQIGDRESSQKEVDEDEHDEAVEAMASNAWHLLDYWRRPPGVSDDGTFSSDMFNQWLKDVLKECKESGHLDIAKSEIGEILYHCPAEPDNSLWIVKAAGEELNKVDNEVMRSGFTSAAFNVRGVHKVNPSGKDEMDLAKTWREKAAAVEKENFHRFASELREFSKRYEHEAERIRKKYLSED